ncbi:MAG: DUF3048 domain-containing protein [Candidatus Pacebacteria bacterium]|nr:DUF3048 domain-containing protein [Candidatus Paceibacterota bacterium]
MPRKHLFIFLILYLISAVGSFTAFSYFKGTESAVVAPETAETQDGDSALAMLLEIDPNAPKDEACPLNGQYFTEVEQQAWAQRRPLFVMIENSVDARPQSGLSRADIVFEAVAEGGVTRYGAMFYCDAQRQDVTIAPVRSARTYFVDWASGFNLPLYVHVGGANVPGPSDALGQIADYGWNMQNDLNQFSIGYPTFVRNYNRLPGKELATEHTMETSTEKLWKVAEEREWTNMSPDRKYGRKTIEGSDWQEGYEGWAYEEEVEKSDEVGQVSYNFWSGYNDYSVSWQYDAQQDKFLRSHGGEEHVDLNNDERIAAANVIVVFSREKGPINEKKHLLYQTTGTGQALIFKHGQAIEGKWVKKDREAELTFVDSKGQEVPLARGLTWISVIPQGNTVEY